MSLYHSTDRRAHPARLAEFDERLWPVTSSLLVLGGCVVVLILWTGRFDDPRLLRNAWFQLAMVGTVMTVLLLGAWQLRNRMVPRLQLCILISLLLHLGLIVALHYQYLELLARSEREVALQEDLHELVVLPDYGRPTETERHVAGALAAPLSNSQTDPSMSDPARSVARPSDMPAERTAAAQPAPNLVRPSKADNSAQREVAEESPSARHQELAIERQPLAVPAQPETDIALPRLTPADNQTRAVLDAQTDSTRRLQPVVPLKGDSATQIASRTAKPFDSQLVARRPADAASRMRERAAALSRATRPTRIIPDSARVAIPPPLTSPSSPDRTARAEQPENTPLRRAATPLAQSVAGARRLSQTAASHAPVMINKPATQPASDQGPSTSQQPADRSRSTILRARRSVVVPDSAVAQQPNPSPGTSTRQTEATADGAVAAPAVAALRREGNVRLSDVNRAGAGDSVDRVETGALRANDPKPTKAAVSSRATDGDAGQVDPGRGSALSSVRRLRAVTNVPLSTVPARGTGSGTARNAVGADSPRTSARPGASSSQRQVAAVPGGDSRVARSASVAIDLPGPVQSQRPPATSARDSADERPPPRLARRRSRPVIEQHSAGISPLYQQRDPEVRARTAEEYGGNKASDHAVELGLEFLARLQFPKGRWSLHDFETAPDEMGSPVPSLKQADTAATGLALLAFLGAGYTHEQGPYRDVVRRGLDHLLSQQKPNGDLFSGGSRVVQFYSHGIASIALCEAYGMTRDAALRGPASRALGYIAASQHPKLGGWRYGPRQESDTSVSGWQLLALKSGELAGLPVSEATYRGIARWLDTARAPGSDGSQYVYLPGFEQRSGSQPSPAMTAEGLLMRLYLGWDRRRPEVTRGVEYLLSNPPQTGSKNRPLRDAYYWYYATALMHHMQDERWQQWDRQIADLLVNSQVREGPLAGSWNADAPVPDRWASAGGPLYVTAMHILILETHYRHLPLFRSLDE